MMSFLKKAVLPLGLGAMSFVAAAILQPLGTNDPYGTNPGNEMINKKYKTKLFAAVYMKIHQRTDGGTSFDMQEQFFDLKKCGFEEGSEKEFSSTVQNIFIYRFRNGNWETAKPNNIDTSIDKEVCLPLLNSDGNYKPSQNMRELYYGKPVKIYVFIDNPGIEFQTAWPITFSQYSGDALAKEEKDWADLKRDKNDTFFNAKVGAKGGFTDATPAADTPAAIASYTANQFLTYDNLYRSKDCWFNWCSAEGREENPENTSEWPVGKLQYRKYAINYNLRVSTGYGNAIIPIAIDPDTGSGTGSPPPARVNN